MKNVKIYQHADYKQFGNKVVVCKLTMNVVVNYDNLKCGKVLSMIFNVLDPIRVEVTTRAKCHPDDKFDFELGKKIAESKAVKKAYSIVQTRISNMANLLYKSLQVFNDVNRDMINLLNNEEVHMNELTKNK